MRCKVPHVTEEAIKAAFLTAMNEVLGSRDVLLSDCRIAQDLLTDTKSIEAELATLHQEIEVVAELSRKAIAENAHTVLDQEAFTKRYNALVDMHDKANPK